MVTTRVSTSRHARDLSLRTRRTAALIVACAASSVLLDASTPRFFRAGTSVEFLRGDLQQLSLDNRGQLRLGPSLDLVHETAAPFLWSVIDGDDGSLLLGTGSEGRVYRVDGQGNSSVFFDAPELEVHAMARASNGDVFVATSPDGRIYRVDEDGESAVFYEAGQRYIWALATDSNGNLYAATGEQAAVYRIGPDGTGSRFYQPPATHVTALAFDREGQLIVGTEAPGRVLRVDNEGRGFVLLDTTYTEISAIRLDAAGSLFVAAVSGAPPSPPPAPTTDTSTTATATDTSGRTPVAIVTTEVTAMVVGDAAATDSSNANQGTRTGRGAVYRIAPDGLWDQVWQSTEDVPYDLAFDGDGRLIVGTGPQGRLFRFEGDPLQPTLLARAGAQQVTALYSRPGGPLHVATANPGKLFRLGSTRAPEGTYQSEVFDAQIVSRWGAVSWRGSSPSGSRIQVRTRSGNTPTPDAGWSEWSSPYSDASGSPITSPNARYLQWQATLSGSGEGPILTSIAAAYLQRNVRPRVQSFTVHPPGIVFERPYAAGEPDLAGFGNQNTPERDLAIAAANQGGSSLGRRTYRRGLQTLIWRADDDNGDDLTYTLHYRREGDAEWTTLREELDEAIFVWNTAAVPDGTYFVRVAASDRPSNAAETALSGELISQAFDIDNTPPDVAVQGTQQVDGATTVTLQVSDGQSIVQRVEYSQDGLVWHTAFPVDGIADSRTERFEIVVENLDARGLSLRAIDAMNNTAAAHAAAPPAR